MRALHIQRGGGHGRHCLVLCLGALIWLLSASAAYSAVSRFAVTYTGSGWWQTVYHSEPPNPGGQPDTDSAHDSSTQHWALRFTGLLTVGRCVGRRPCVTPRALSAAAGTTRVTGTIDHTHLDGLYGFDNASERCQVAAATPAGWPLQAGLTARLGPDGKGVVLQALMPVSEALLMLPPGCPSQGDSLDGLNDNYFTPGFNFSTGFGPSRWFSSAPVWIPIRRLQRASRLSLPLTDTPAGTPPATCGPAPSYVHCLTWGAWRGTLTLARED